MMQNDRVQEGPSVMYSLIQTCRTETAVRDDEMKLATLSVIVSQLLVYSIKKTRLTRLTGKTSKR